MKFGLVRTTQAAGAILAHAIKTETGRIAKGARLDAQDLTDIAAAGFEEITVARLEDGDLDEDQAARGIADALVSPTLQLRPAGKGRCNLYALQAGIITVDAAAIVQANQIDEALTVSTLQPGTTVTRGQLVATVKVITFGAPEGHVAAVAAHLAGAVSIAGFKPRTAALLQTRLPHTSDALLEKTAHSTRERLTRVGATIVHESTTDHDAAVLASSLREVSGHVQLITIIGASAIVDRRDVIPTAIIEAGGTVQHFGLPVDPGNLTLLGQVGDATVLAMPGSARSPREQGSDWLLARIAAELPIDAPMIAGFGVGGLLKEIRSRPLLREHRSEAQTPAAPTVDAVLLAAGQSKRMGARNKLLERVDNDSLVGTVAAAIQASRVREIFVVTGHETEKIINALEPIDCQFVFNPDFASGMGTSLAAGIRAATAPDRDLPDAIIVCLGDMPDVTSAMIDRVINNFDPSDNRLIVAAAHQGRRGNPVLWDRRFFDDLASLNGDQGAREILREHAEHVITVDVASNAVLTDLDTPQAFDQYRNDQRSPEAGTGTIREEGT